MSTSRCAAAARVMQPKVTATAEGVGGGGGGGGSGGDGRGVGPPAFAAGAVGIITAQRRCATRASGRLSTR